MGFEARIALGILAIIMLVLALLPGREQRAPDTSVAQRSDADARALISPDALAPYPKSQWPKLYARYPEHVIATELPRLRAAVALAAAKDPRCDKVEMAEYAPSASTSVAIAVFADCANGFRVRIGPDGAVTMNTKLMRP